MFERVEDPVGLLAAIHAAVSTAGDTDAEIDNAHCRLRVCAWDRCATRVLIGVRLYSDTPARVFYAEFARRSGDAFVFWRVLRHTLLALQAGGGLRGHLDGPVAH